MHLKLLPTHSLKLLSGDGSIELTTSCEIVTCSPSSQILCNLAGLEKASATVFSIPCL